MSPLERSASIAFGDDFATLVSWVRATTPQDSTIVLPPTEAAYVLGNTGIMQYFLMPRTITDCPDSIAAAVCLAGLRGSRTYILGAAGWPPPEAVSADRDYLPITEDLGVYAPQGKTPGDG